MTCDWELNAMKTYSAIFIFLYQKFFRIQKFILSLFNQVKQGDAKIYKGKADHIPSPLTLSQSPHTMQTILIALCLSFPVLIAYTNILKLIYLPYHQQYRVTKIKSFCIPQCNLSFSLSIHKYLVKYISSSGKI